MPRFKLYKSKVLEQYNKVKEIVDLVSYSSKTNPLITPILEDNTDSMFSIHIKNELKHVRDMSRVIFLAQAWNKEDVKDLLQQGVINFVVDNEFDLDVFLETVDKEVTLFLRLKLKENTLKTERHFVFGMNSDVINKRLKEINDSNITLGLHFHRKTQNMSEWGYKYELSRIIDEENLRKIKILNIGGGLPSDYANTNVDVIKSIFVKIKGLKGWLNGYDVKLMVEPGRFIAAPSCVLETEIVGVHDNNIVVDASVYNSDMDALIVPVKLLVEGELDKGVAYVIKGITPCSLDLFRYRVYLDNPKKGDKVVFLNAGAYNFCTGFCDLDKVECDII